MTRDSGMHFSCRRDEVLPGRKALAADCEDASSLESTWAPSGSRIENVSPRYGRHHLVSPGLAIVAGGRIEAVEDPCDVVTSSGFDHVVDQVAGLLVGENAGASNFTEHVDPRA